MTLYVIRGDSVTAHASPPATISEDQLLVQSIEDIEASGLSKAELTAIWNALPGATKLAKFSVPLCRAGGSELGRLRTNPWPRRATPTPLA